LGRICDEKILEFLEMKTRGHNKKVKKPSPKCGKLWFSDEPCEKSSKQLKEEGKPVGKD